MCIMQAVESNLIASLLLPLQTAAEIQQRVVAAVWSPGTSDSNNQANRVKQDSPYKLLLFLKVMLVLELEVTRQERVMHGATTPSY